MENDTFNAIINSATLTLERGFILSSFIHLEYDDGGQGFGGYSLGGASGTNFGDHTGGNFAAEWIVNVLRAADVEDWAKLTGKAVRIRKKGGWSSPIVGIGHIIKDDRWFYPEEAFERLKASEARS